MPTVYEIVTEQIIHQLEEGTAPWRKPWTSDLPTSMSTGKPYRGVNVFLLAAQTHESSWWGTYKQIQQRGGQVRKGERSTIVTFWTRYDRKTGETTDTGDEETRRSFVLKFYRVFNACQAEWADGMPAKFQPDTRGHDHDPIAAAEELVKGYIDGGPTLIHGGSRACYSPSADRVSIPALPMFDTAEEYYSTLFHELTHSTGHKSRLAREGITELHFFGDESYGKEELIAEMGAAMLAGLAGIEQVTLPNSAAYLASWIRTLKGEPKMVVQAAAAAQKAADMVAGVSFSEQTGEGVAA